MDEKSIKNIVNKHFRFSLLMALAPILFIMIINWFAKNDNTLLLLIAPFTTLGACAYLIKEVISEIFSVDKS